MQWNPEALVSEFSTPRETEASARINRKAAGRGGEIPSAPFFYSLGLPLGGIRAIPSRAAQLRVPGQVGRREVTRPF